MKQSQLEAFITQDWQTIQHHKLAPPRHLTPSPQGPQSYLPLPQETAWDCVSGPTAQCTAVTTYTLSCSCHGKLMGWLVGKRVVLELSRDGEAEDCSRAPVHLVPPSASLAWQAPDGPGSFLELTEAVKVT